MSLHLKKIVPPAAPTSIPLTLHVGVITSQKIYYDGQYGNITVQVRDQYGQAMPGVTVNIGYNPSGSMLNISSYTGVTNSNGIYKFEFEISPSNTIVYTPGYDGNITIIASASSSYSSVTGGSGKAHMDVAPAPALYKTSTLPLINSSTKMKYFNITLYNATTGKPISGYKYDIQALNGALNILNTSANQSILYTKDIDFFGIPYQGIPVNKTINDYNITSISGITGISGNISILMSYNSTFNFTFNGAYYTTYIFIGDYAAGAPVTGKLNYMQLGEETSIYNSAGFGVAEPFEIPVMITNNSNSKVNIQVSTNHLTAYNGETAIILYATDKGKALSNYHITLTSQNVLGANRGYFVGGNGIGYNPNFFFGSINMPEISVTTNSTGYATVEFSSGLYAPMENSSGSTIGYKGIPFESSRMVPYDEFNIGIMSGNYTNETYIVSTPFIFNSTIDPYLTSFATVYLQDSSILNNFTTIKSGTSYKMYVNSTYNTMAGPDYGNIPFTISAKYGTLSTTSGKTNSNGTYSITYKAPEVKVMTLITITIKTDGNNATYIQSFYVLPVSKTVKPNYDYYDAAIIVLAAIAVIFIGLYTVDRRKLKK